MPTIIITDSNCDVTEQYLKDNNNPVIPFSFTIAGNEYIDDFGRSLSYADFYTMMKQGDLSSTSQINPYAFEKIFRQYLNEGFDVIYLGFSSNLSKTFSNAMIVKNMLLEEKPEYKLEVIDSISATSGQALLLYEANKMNNEGKSFNDIVEWLENNKNNVNVWFTVNDLFHLKRGGRISAASATLGSMAQVKPVMNMSRDGKLEPKSKVRTRKKSLLKLVEEIDNRIINPENQIIFINHGNCVKDAEYVKSLILDKWNTQVEINYIGPVIGAHTGEGVIALAFRGTKRD